jgi:transcriptional regulator with XRE-family HTH domain
MQAIAGHFLYPPYTGRMQTGRPSRRQRPPFGERLHALREKAGLTQAQVAKPLGISARAYAFWERNPVALKADQLAVLATVFDVSVDYLVGQEPAKKPKGGPVGRARRAFERVSKLPRSRQHYILKVVEDLVGSASGK